MKSEYQLLLKVLEKGAEIGYAPHKLPLLLLVPFVQIAWAEGFMQANEQKAILRFAANLGVKPGHSSFELLLEWFDERPTDEFFENALEDLSELLKRIPEKQAARLRTMLQFGCVETAHAAGDIGLLRGRSNIRREEREHLQIIGARLGLAQSYI